MKQTALLLLLSFLFPATAWTAITQAGYYDRTLQLKRSATGGCLWESYPSKPTPVQCQAGSVDYHVEGTAQLIDTGLLPFHDAIFDVAAGTRTDCP